MKPHLMIVNAKSHGAELRVFKCLRLMLLYSYTADNQCLRRSTKHRYERATERMRYRLRQVLRNHWTGYTRWDVKILGSHKVIDLQLNRRLEFLIILTSPGEPEK